MAREWAGTALAASLGAFLFLWHVGRSSWFIDEVSSANLADSSARAFAHQIHFVETSPPVYFGFLNGWAWIFGGVHEASLRTPSALAGIALVIAVSRLGFLLGGRRAAATAAILTAVSPLVLEYAQQARPYAILMLAATLTVLAALEASRRGSRRWLVVEVALAISTLWIHYFGLLVVLPVVAWSASRGQFRKRDRLGVCLATGIGWAASLPLAYLQYKQHPNGGLGAYANLTAGHMTRILGNPFDGRYNMDATGVPVVLGAALVAAAFAFLVAHRHRIGNSSLLICTVAIPVALLFVLGVAGKDVVVTRYSTAATPFFILTLAVAMSMLPRASAAAALSATLALAVWGVVLSERRTSDYPDTRTLVQRVADGWEHGDVLVDASQNFGVQYPLRYYAAHDLPRGARVIFGSELPSVIASAGRLWIVGKSPTPTGFIEAGGGRLVGSTTVTYRLLVRTRSDRRVARTA